MSILAGRDEAGYDAAEELIADLAALVNRGLITRVRQVGGPTRYALVPQGDDDDGGGLSPGSGAVFSAG
jgi:hypothetical protein